MEDSEFVQSKEYQTVFYKYIGDGIRRQRKYINLTQDDLAFILGISRVSINNIENGKQRLPLHVMVALADILSIPLNDITPHYNYGIKTISELKAHKIKIAIEKINGLQ